MMPLDELHLPLLLQQAVTRLAADARVVGVVLIGSLATQQMNPASDYDLLVISDHEPLWFVGVSRIGGRFVDVLFVATRALDLIQRAVAPLSHDDPLAAPWRWVASGVIVWDPTSSIQQAQQTAQRHGAPHPPDTEAAYQAWFSLNYNLAVIERMIVSPDPHYRMVAAIRMALYGHSDLWHGYFTMRHLPWPGDKAAYTWLTLNDPAYLAHYQQFIAESQPDAKLAWYRRLADLATVPLGGRWPTDWAGETLLHPPLRVVDLLGEPT